MISRMLFSKVDKWQLRIVFLGGTIGFLFLLTVIHYFGEVKNMGQGGDALGANLVVAQKRVTKYSSFDSKSTIISQNEIETLSQHPAVAHVSQVINNQFYVSLAMREEGLPYFSTDIFIQSIDNDLLDIQLDAWSWKDTDDFVPLVMPRDFMLMLNQFASSYKIPAVSEDIAKTLNFTLDLSGNGKKLRYKARIIGFSNQMNGVLVPIDFMKMGNQDFAKNDALETTQLVLKMNERQYSDFEKLMDSMNLDIKENELLVVKVQGVLYGVLGVLFIIALLIVVLCAMMIVQFSLLLLAHSDYEIKTMLRLGYHPKDLAQYFYRYFLRLFAMIVIFVLPLFLSIKWLLDRSIENFGFPTSSMPSIIGLLSVLILSWLIVFVNYKRVKNKITTMVS